jgi:cell division septum initiation protein DivIVA
MELLELLENRIDALFAEIERLRTENAVLQDQLSSCEQKLFESSQYIDALKHEQQNAEFVKERLEALMQRIETVLSK